MHGRREAGVVAGVEQIQEALKFMDHEEAPMRAYAIDTLRQALLSGTSHSCCNIS